MTQTDPSVISGGTLLTVDIVVQWRDGPHQLSGYDGDDDGYDVLKWLLWGFYGSFIASLWRGTWHFGNIINSVLALIIIAEIK